MFYMQIDFSVHFLHSHHRRWCPQIVAGYVCSLACGYGFDPDVLYLGVAFVYFIVITISLYSDNVCSFISVISTCRVACNIGVKLRSPETFDSLFISLTL